MYYVVICDDDERFVSHMEKLVYRANEQLDLELKVCGYVSGEAMLQGVKTSSQCDLLILDIMLGGMDGDETARHFRQMFHDAVLVFCSGNAVPSARLFQVTPFRYLTKSQPDFELVSELSEALVQMERTARDSYLVGHCRSSVMRVRLRDVLYVEIARRGSRVVPCPGSSAASFGEQILVDEKLDELSERHAELVFLHNSYIVNINHVECVNGSEAVLDDGERMLISKARKKEFRKAFAKLLAGKY